MVHHLVTKGEFQILRAVDKRGARIIEKRPGTFDELHGMLGFVDYVRYKNNEVLGKDSDKEKLSSEEETYKSFLMYRLFYAAERPTILCEGATDNVYLTHAVRSLARDFPDLAEVEASGKINFRVRLYRYPKSSTRRLLKFGDGGCGVLAAFIRQYERETGSFGAGLRNPVVVLFDDDSGGKAVRKAIKDAKGQAPPAQFPFIHVVKNLYAVPTPGENSTIENFFDSATRALGFDGKVFHEGGEGFDEALHFGKKVFAHQVVRPNADSINFEGFRELLNNLSAAIRQHRQSLLSEARLPASSF
jgi:hypothetical protein